MIHFALISYSPNTAAMNRMRGYWNLMESRGIDVCVTFLHQENVQIKVEGEYEHIKFHYYDGHYGHNKVVVLLAFWYNLLRFSASLKKGDVVYTYGINKVTSFLLKRKGIKLIAEVTEHPSVLDGGRIVEISAEDRYVVARKLNGLIAISESLKKVYVENGVDSNNVSVVNMMVDPNRFIGIEKRNNKVRYITYCGTASNNKDGIDELIKAFNIVAKQIDDVRLRIIGQTPSLDDSSGNLQMIKEMGIGDRIEFTGYVDYKMIPQMLTDASVLALDRPDSLQAQCGFPTKLGEYLLTGNPVVVTRVGDIPIFLKDGESALLANERDPEDFASKLIWVLNHPEEAVAIGGKGKEVANEFFNAEKETDKLIKVLNN